MAHLDLDLAAAAAQGDRAAYGELVKRAAPLVRDLLRRMGADAATAEDMAHDAMIAAWRAIGSYRGEAAFASWCMRIAARLYLKRKKRDACMVVMAEPIGADAFAPSGGVLSRTRLDLDRALAQLSEAERMCVSLCHGAGLTGEEIAESLRLPLGTVKSHVNRGLQKLRVLMTSEGGYADG